MENESSKSPGQGPVLCQEVALVPFPRVDVSCPARGEAGVPPACREEGVAVCRLYFHFFLT